MTTTEQTTATVTAGPFGELITDLLRTAGTDDTLPMLVGIRLHSDKIGAQPVVVGVSTDRFSMGQAHTEATGQLPEVFVPTSSCKRILGALKLINPAALLELAVDDLTLSFTGDDVSVRVPLKDIEFPKFWKIFENHDEAEPDPVGTAAAYNPAVLQPFQMIAKSRGESLHIAIKNARTGATITIGDRYRGLLMPVRKDLPAVPLLLAPSEHEHRAKHEAAQAEAAAKAKRSAAAKKAAATRKANAGNKPATKTTNRRPAGRRKAA